jgi:hypothetical protein
MVLLVSSRRWRGTGVGAVFLIMRFEIMLPSRPKIKRPREARVTFHVPSTLENVV